MLNVNWDHMNPVKALNHINAIMSPITTSPYLCWMHSYLRINWFLSSHAIQYIYSVGGSCLLMPLYVHSGLHKFRFSVCSNWQRCDMVRKPRLQSISLEVIHSLFRDQKSYPEHWNFWDCEFNSVDCFLL